LGCLVTAHLKLAAIGAHPRHRERAKKEDLMSSFPRCAELIEMKPGKIAHAIAVLLSSISLFLLTRRLQKQNLPR